MNPVVLVESADTEYMGRTYTLRAATLKFWGNGGCWVTEGDDECFVLVRSIQVIFSSCLSGA